ncbi:hypothetical protein [Paludisphaera borealis]|uniref:hypothetical protein n=1 Tax=Paludisphaera borealis TaxID=1387353 RepID=UPI0009703A97|nr:hypothetical protein [Paludisphaera borealis]
MIVLFPATTSRTSHSVSEPSAGASPSRATDWGARIVQISLAIYLLPVLVLLFMIGGVGIAAVGLVVLAAKVLRWGGRSRGVEGEEDAFRS